MNRYSCMNVEKPVWELSACASKSRNKLVSHNADCVAWK